MEIIVRIAQIRGNSDDMEIQKRPLGIQLLWTSKEINIRQPSGNMGFQEPNNSSTCPVFSCRLLEYFHFLCKNVYRSHISKYSLENIRMLNLLKS